jgi:carboxypeptidase T
MKKFIILLLAISSLSGFAQQEKYSEVKIFILQQELVKLARLGIPVDDGVFNKEGYWKTVLSARDMKKITDAGFSTEVLHDDYSAYIQERNKEWFRQNKGFDRNKSGQPKNPTVSGYKVPVHFELGSMGGYYTLQEVMNELDSMVLLYPGLITAKQPVSAQTTIEGRQIYYVKISKNPNTAENEPKILYDALTHAREPEGMQQLMFYMWYLLENYDTDPEIKYLVDNLEMYFIPVINADGYEYNYTISPFGGGYWRKNRKDNGDGTYGVDLNRNWGYAWGYDDLGSSPYPGDDTYRGSGPFSEPETQIVRDFFDQVHFREAINYHTYGDIFLIPWSYITEYTLDSTEMINHADVMTRQNRYSTGVSGELLYTCNGEMNDWAYGEQTEKPKVLSYTPETGNDNDGFWPTPDRIVPLCQENMYQNIMLAHLALRYAETRDIQPSIVSERQGYFKFQFERYGIEAPANYNVTLIPMDTAQITNVGAPRNFMNPAMFHIFTDSIAYTLSPNLTAGDEFQYILKIDNGIYSFMDTVTKYFGPALIAFQDSCDTFLNWTSGKWNVTTSSYYSPPGSITDSPNGNYSSNTDVTVTTWNSIDLKDSPVATISYWTRWDTERCFDYVQPMVSTDNGLHYTPQKGRYTRIGSANEDEGAPVYDWKQANWVNEEIVLTNTTNRDLKFRFEMVSDASKNYDGLYFDNFTVSIIDMSGVGMEEKGKSQVFLSDPVPNPATSGTQIRYNVTGNRQASFELLDSRGIQVRSIRLTESHGMVILSTQDLPAGIYFYRITGSFGTSDVKKLIVIR